MKFGKWTVIQSDIITKFAVKPLALAMGSVKNMEEFNATQRLSNGRYKKSS